MRATTLTLRRLSSIPTQPLHWLWQNRIPRGKITLLAGDPGSGKTALLLDLAARLSTARPLPPIENQKSKIENPPQTSPLDTRNSTLDTPLATLLLSPNDDPADTLRPKLEALHANLDLIHLLEDFHTLIPAQSSALSPQSFPTPIEKLEAAIAAIPNLALVVIDPITHFLGLTDRLAPPTPDDPDSPRSILAQLAALAQKHHIALLLTTRLTKKVDPTLPAHSLQKILGPLAFPSTARSVLLLTPYPTSLSTQHSALSTPSPTHLLLPLKLSAAPLPNPLPFTLAEPILWHPEIPLASLRPTPNKTPGPPDTATQSAIAFLQSILAHGPVSALTMANDTKSNNIASSTLERAKTFLRIQSVKQDWSGKWFWRLPDDTRPLPENLQDRHFAEMFNRPAPAMKAQTRRGGGNEPDDLAGISRISHNEPDDLAGNSQILPAEPDDLAEIPTIPAPNSTHSPPPL